MIRGPVLLLAGALGCSNSTAVGPAPEAPAGAPAVAVKSGVYKLVVGSSHELSCSQSFETHTEHTSYELTLGDDGNASLAVRARSTTVFGPSSSKFSGGPSTKTDELNKQLRFVGRMSGGSKFEGVEEKSGQKVWLTCSTSRVEIDDKGGDAGKATIDAVSCDGLPYMPEDGSKYFKGPAHLALTPGVYLSIDNYGFGGDHVSFRRGL